MSASSRAGAVLTAALLLSACTSGPDYQKPDLTLAPYHTEVAKTEPAPPLDRWWSGFHDAELEKIVDRALEQISIWPPRWPVSNRPAPWRRKPVRVCCRPVRSMLR